MTLTLSHDLPWGGEPGDPEANNQNWVGLVIIGILFLVAFHWEGWQKGHQRRARLDAYRRRDKWRMGDVPRLRKLGVPPHRIQQIIADNKHRGRGVVQNYRSLDEVVELIAQQANVLLSPDTQPHKRLSTLKQTPLWQYIVEALYRGEHTAAREERMKSPSTHAERMVADCLGISDSQVHKICGGVRKERKLENKDEGDFLLRVGDFQRWQLDGSLHLP
jgi:hypothetical protein